jgi:hypothetical protein
MQVGSDLHYTVCHNIFWIIGTGSVVKRCNPALVGIINRGSAFAARGSRQLRAQTADSISEGIQPHSPG